MGEVKINATHMIKPAGEPWTGTMKLGDWDQMVSAAYFSIICFYRPNPEWAGQSGQSFLDTLKASLAKALFQFYPLAGRVHRAPNGRAELHCECQGAEVVEAESGTQLADFGDFSCSRKFEPLIPVVDVLRKPIHELPLISVQITRFRCGGISLGFAINHGAADGLAAFHFLHEWARLSRGESLQTPPLHDRTLLRAGEPFRGPGFGPSNVIAPLPPDSPILAIDETIKMPAMKETSMIVLHLSKAQIDKLRNAANSTVGDEPTKDSPCCRPFSRYEVLTAHIWRCACKAKGNRSGDEPKTLAITLDARTRVNPPLPSNYFGSAVLMVAATIKTGDLTTRPLEYVCSVIRETITKVTDEYIQADIDDLKNLENLGLWRGVRSPVDLSFTMPELGVISWLTLPIHGLDFGWGDHVHISPGPTAVDGVACILPVKAGDGSLFVDICFDAEHVDKFKSFFYEDLL